MLFVFELTNWSTRNVIHHGFRDASDFDLDESFVNLQMLWRLYYGLLFCCGASICLRDP